VKKTRDPLDDFTELPLEQQKQRLFSVIQKTEEELGALEKSKEELCEVNPPSHLCPKYSAKGKVERKGDQKNKPPNK